MLKTGYFEKSGVLYLVPPRRQLRTEPVPCHMCGLKMERGVPVPATMTFRHSGLCMSHEIKTHDNDVLVALEEARRDFD